MIKYINFLPSYEVAKEKISALSETSDKYSIYETIKSCLVCISPIGYPKNSSGDLIFSSNGAYFSK